MRPDAVEERAPAKINLDLRVLGRRPDGYHELDSLVVFADLADRLVFERAPEMSLRVVGPESGALGTGPDNLALRAATMLKERAAVADGARIILDKKIPVAAGLGGGSADAAATLRGLALLWDLDLPEDALLRLAREIGADVPVCMHRRTVRMRGLGERLTPAALDPLDLVVVNPRVGVPTREVFRALAAPPFDPTRAGADDAPRRCWQEGGNDLEAPACRLAPVIGEVLALLRAQPGAGPVRMSGSGATCFAAFRDGPIAAGAAARLRAARPGWWIERVRAG